MRLRGWRASDVARLGNVCGQLCKGWTLLSASEKRLENPYLHTAIRLAARITYNAMPMMTTLSSTVNQNILLWVDKTVE